MKKLFLCIALVATATTYTQAQTADTTATRPYQSNSSPNIEFSTKALVNGLKTADEVWRKKLHNDSLAAARTASKDIYYSNMPTAVKRNEEQDHMPVARAGDKSTNYTILVKRVKIKQVLPEGQIQGTYNTDKSGIN
ncbi:hypothetical protein [Mucilaginibacter aquatilis]|uniref:Uncharacterized protein n=1 Tax=Mucilaginibacter aquatilis TaxID=1517760 RepID=A0A6I4I9V9_9SPHI|nr:hypothetical protein [Mucilaginibacter aquatilis]MVN90778.1 hypothetical protein [Mucilaginibacter aquatilis]